MRNRLPKALILAALPFVGLCVYSAQNDLGIYPKIRSLLTGSQQGAANSFLLPEQQVPAEPNIFLASASQSGKKNTTNNQAHSAKSHEEKQPSLAQATKIETLEDLMAHLKHLDPGKFNFDAVADYVNASPDGLDQVLQAYAETDSPSKRQLLLSILDNVDNPQKMDFAVELATFGELEERSRAYGWLASSDPAQDPETYQILVDAMSGESDPRILNVLLSRMPFPSQDTDKPNYDRVLGQLESLASHADEQLAASAVQAIGRIEPSGQAMAILQAKIHEGEGIVQLEALRSLSNIKYPDEAILSSLNLLAATPSVPQSTRREAVQLVVAFENRLGVYADDSES